MGGVTGSKGSNPDYDRKSSLDGVAQIGFAGSNSIDNMVGIKVIWNKWMCFRIL